MACFFALTYWLFRRALHRDDRRPQERSLLLCAWLVLFVVNAGQVVRMQGEVWSISENSDQATVRMFFSPSCSACREGIGILSGSVDVAFCPVAENDADVARVERMLLLLEEGKTLKEAVAACQNVEEPGPWAFLHPGQWGLRLRLQRNRAHIFNAGSRTVPFFEYHGPCPCTGAGHRIFTGRWPDVPGRRPAPGTPGGRTVRRPCALPVAAVAGR